MASISKIIGGTTIVAGLAWLGYYLFGKKQLGDKMDTLTSGSIHSLNLQGLTIRVNVVLKNPTQYSIKIKQPYVKLLLNNGKLIGSSQIVNKQIEILPYGVQQIDPIYVTIPISGLLALGNSFYQMLLKKQPVKITVITMSIIDLEVKMLPYVKKDEITLNAPKTIVPAAKPKVPAKTKPKT